MSLNLIDSAIANQVTLYCLLLHTTHLGQALKIHVHKPSKDHFSTITDFITLPSVTHGTSRVNCEQNQFPYSI